MAIRPFGYNIVDGKYVINTTEADAIRDYYEHVDLYLRYPSEFESKWRKVIISYLNEIDEKDVDIIKQFTEKPFLKDSGEIVDKDTWEKVQAVINSRK